MVIEETQHKNVLSIYTAIANLSIKMAEAAEKHDWESLRSLESECASHMRSISSIKEGEPHGSEYTERKFELLSLIMANDRKIRDITSPWMRRVESLLYSRSEAH